MKGKKNKNGDYVLTNLFIEDNRVGVKKVKKEAEEDSSSDEGYGDEDDVQEVKKVEAKEEVKEAPKQKSKK